MTNSLNRLFFPFRTLLVLSANLLLGLPRVPFLPIVRPEHVYISCFPCAVRVGTHNTRVFVSREQAVGYQKMKIDVENEGKVNNLGRT